MTHILNQVAKSFRSEFKPSSPEGYFALRLAYLLGEPEAATHYVTLASQYPKIKLLGAYKRATAKGHGNVRASKVFHEHLEAVGTTGNYEGPHSKLLAVRIERRTVAVALFSGLHLEGRRVLQLSSDLSRAQANAPAFVDTVLSENKCSNAAIESIDSDVRRAELHSAVLRSLRENEVSVSEVDSPSIITSFANPPLKLRVELRDVMLSMYPVQDLKKTELCVLDAFALGLYVQTERLFSAGR